MRPYKIYIPIAIFLAIGTVLEFLSISLGFYTGLLLFIFYLVLTSILWTNTSSFLIITAFTLLLEAIGLAASIPFGHYLYGESVSSPALFGVPLFIPLAWYILIASATQIASKWYYASLLIIFIDIILEIFAVASGLWTWPGHSGILTAPLQNYLTWGIVAAGGYFVIKKDKKLKPHSVIILSTLISYMVIVILIYMLK